MSKIKVALATSNQGKLDEFEQILEPFRIDLFRGAKISSPEENGRTYFENAAIKARNGAINWGVPCIGEDSGIEVVGLNYLPGHLTDRFGGFGIVDVNARRCDHFVEVPKAERTQKNNQKILGLLKGKTGDDRVAIFRACVVVADTLGKIIFANEPSVFGRILDAPRGDCGFGFDPIMEFFEYPGRSIAELTSDEKNLVSPRGQAINQLLRWLANTYR